MPANVSPPLPVQITSQASLGCLHILDGETHRKVIWSTLSGLSRSSLSFLPSSESGHICRMTSVRPCPIMPQLQLIAPVQKWMSILLAVFGSAVLIGSREWSLRCRAPPLMEQQYWAFWPTKVPRGRCRSSSACSPSLDRRPCFGQRLLPPLWSSRASYKGCRLRLYGLQATPSSSTPWERIKSVSRWAMSRWHWQ